MVVDRHQGLRLRARKLAAAAAALKHQSGQTVPFSLAFLTDHTRIAQPEVIARVLPRGAAVILRDYESPQRVGLAKRLSVICKARGVFLLVGNDPDLAIAVNADGVHCPRWSKLKQADLPDRFIMTAGCHNDTELITANERGATMALLSPAFPTNSHIGKAGIGIAAFKSLADQAPLPVIALGGVTPVNAHQLTSPNVVGIAAIGAFNAN